MSIPKNIKASNNVTVHAGDKLTEGDLCELYRCTWDEPEKKGSLPVGDRFDKILDGDEFDDPNNGVQGVMKVVLDPLDDDLVENEWNMLTKLFPEKEKDEKFFRYLPKPIATGQLTKGGRRFNVVQWLERYVSLAQVLDAYPKGLPNWEDAVWMLNRVLEGIGFVHTKQIVHGALVPEHCMVHPTGHGAKLIDWSYSTSFEDRSEARVKAMVRARADFYPPEIPGRERVSPATDLYFVGKLGIALMGGDVKTDTMPTEVPATVQSFMKDLVNPSRTMRPQDAWDVREEFDKVVIAIVGKRRYRKFEMPK